MLSLRIEAPTYPELIAKLEQYLSTNLPRPIVSAPVAPAAGSPTLPAPAPRNKGGRPRKNPAPAAAPSGETGQNPVATAAPQVEVGNTTSGSPVAPAPTAPAAAPAAPAASGDVPTIDTLRQKINEYNGKFGFPKTLALLGTYSAKRLQEVPEGKRAELIGKIDAAVQSNQPAA